MDGYFPSELQSQFPDGVPFKLTDQRHMTYEPPNSWGAGVHGSGQKLGGQARPSKLSSPHTTSKLPGLTHPHTLTPPPLPYSRSEAVGRSVPGSSPSLRDQRRSCPRHTIRGLCHSQRPFPTLFLFFCNSPADTCARPTQNTVQLFLHTYIHKPG